MNLEEFEASKIFEKLQEQPMPEGYAGKIPWHVQCQIAATNGVHYIDMIGKLKDYPIPNIPVEKVEGQKLMLDIGNGWGRWLTAGGKKNYIPVGIDFRLEFCQTARRVMKDNGVNGYSVVADLKKLPFKGNIFDLVWSFSVIQHTHYDRLISCVSHIARILNNNGFCKLEFPNKSGIHNRFTTVKQEEPFKDDYNSWCVRYYTVKEYETIFKKYFDNFDFQNHSALGIGVLDNDLDFIENKKVRMQIKVSFLLSKIFSSMKALTKLSDSIYIIAKKENVTNNDILPTFFKAHAADPGNPLNVFHLLACPITNGDLVLSEDGQFLISAKAQRKFPVIEQTPILVESQSLSL